MGKQWAGYRRKVIDIPRRSWDISGKKWEEFGNNLLNEWETNEMARGKTAVIPIRTVSDMTSIDRSK